MYQIAIAVKQIAPKYNGFRQWHTFTISPCLCVQNLGVAELGASSADSQITVCVCLEPGGGQAGGFWHGVSDHGVCVSGTRWWPSWRALVWILRSRCLCVWDRGWASWGFQRRVSHQVAGKPPASSEGWTWAGGAAPELPPRVAGSRWPLTCPHSMEATCPPASNPRAREQDSV